MNEKFSLAVVLANRILANIPGSWQLLFRQIETVQQKRHHQLPAGQWFNTFEGPGKVLQFQPRQETSGFAMV